MNFINHFSIKIRIIILVLIPLLFTLGLAIDKYRSARLIVNEVEQLAVLQQYIHKVSPLISALYQERMYAKFYMGTQGDPESGQVFEDDFKATHAAVDSALTDYMAYIANTTEIAAFPKLMDDIARVKTSLAIFPRARSRAAKQIHKEADPSIDDGFFRTLREYNILINSLVTSSQQIVLLSASNENLALLANTYQNLVTAQDASMLFFANIYQIIVTRITIPTLGNISRQFGQEQQLLQSFKLYSSPQTIEFFNRTLEETAFNKEYNKVYEKARRTVPQAVSTPFALDKDGWLEIGKSRIRAYEALTKQLLDNIHSTQQQILDNARQVVNLTLITIIVLLLLLSWVSVVIITSILKPIKLLMRDFTELADSKNMTLRSNIKGDNELSKLGAAFNSLVESFEATLSQVRSQVVDMGSSASNVSESMDKSKALIDKQRVATDSISVAVEEITSTIHEVSTMSSSTSDAVKRAYDLSQASEENANDSKHTMEQLSVELGDTRELVTLLNDEANKISGILQVIKGISEQTNLLALNAAIEAARAGEKGRGFAVVADEVRQLSKRTNESTEQIQAQIESLTSRTLAASEKMDTLQHKGEQAADVVQVNMNAIVEIKTELDQITDMATQIAVSAEEQTNVADEINQRIHSIKDDSENMSVQGAETQATTQSMQINASLLKEKIEVFHFN